MFFNMLVKSFTRNIRQKILAVMAVSIGISVAAAMLNIWLDIGDKMGREMKSYGSNILVKPKAQALPFDIGNTEYDPLKGRVFINESDLPKIKTVFWQNNIIGFAPKLDVKAKLIYDGKNIDNEINVTGTWFNKKLPIPTGETIYTGIKHIKSWWDIEGKWVDESKDATGQAIIGKKLSKEFGIKTGDNIKLMFPSGRSAFFRIKGITKTDSEDDNKLFAPLDDVQKMVNLENKVGWVEVSALTTPDNELAKRYERNPDLLSSSELEKWYCTAYVGAISYQIEEAIPGVESKPIRQIAQSESAVIGKVQLLAFFLTALALVSSCLGILSLMGANILERRQEIGLAKAIGANNSSLIRFFISETALIGIIGGIIGYLISLLLAQMIGIKVFNRPVEIKSFVAPISISMAVIIVIIGNLSALQSLIKLKPKDVLHGG